MRPLLAAVALGVALLLGGAPPAPAAPVSFDRYSLRIEGRRVVLNSGEVHPARMPDPREWPAVLARLRAAGLNAISIYVPWSYHEPARGRYRWRGRYDLERFLALARDAGLYVVVRPGPYINAETDGGGFPYWLLGRSGVLRSADARYTKAWKAWFAAVLPRVARWQLGGGRRGTVIAVQIENEYSAMGAGPDTYMRDLYATARADGITVPLLHNDQALRRRFENVVDLYGFDTYPYGFACCPAWGEATFAGLDGVEAQLPAAARRSPIYVPELQGGAVDLVGGAGESTSRRLYGALAGYSTVQDLTVLGQGATMLNRYMAFGGTSWGYTPFPLMGSSYDYAAPVREWLGLGPRYDELRRISGQIETAGPSLAATRADAGAVTGDVPGAVYRVRRSLVDGALHVLLRNAGDAADQAPRLRVGAATTPPVPLPRRSARYLLAGARVAGWSITWSTAEAMLASRRTLVLFGDRGRRYAAMLDGRRVDFTPAEAPRAIRFSGGRTLVVVDRAQAARTWRWRGGLVVGPELVSSREVLTDQATTAYLLERRALRRVRLPGPPGRGGLALPALDRWRFAAEAPERRASFDDSGWRAVDHRTTTNRIQPLAGPVLDADAYGLPTGYVWYRGRFEGSATGVCLEGRHRYFAWVNGRPLGAVTSAADVPSDSLGAGTRSQPVRLRFPSDAVKAAGTNVLAVLTDDWGHSQDTFVNFGAKTPRGLISAALDRGAGASCGFRDAGSELRSAAPVPPPGGISWRVQGGDPRDYPNASGLFGERDGWFAPRFDDRGWKAVRLPDGGRLAPGQIGWYRTSFSVHLPRGVRARLGIDLPGAAPGELFLNGVHVARVGRDRSSRFVLTSGVLRTDGRPNVLALARWAFGNAGGLGRPRLFAYATERAVQLPAPRRPSARPPAFTG